MGKGGFDGACIELVEMLRVTWAVRLCHSKLRGRYGKAVLFLCATLSYNPDSLGNQ